MLYSIHTAIYVSRDLSKYEYVKYNTRLPGVSSTKYDLTDEEVSDYFKRGFKVIKIGDQFVLYEQLSYI